MKITNPKGWFYKGHPYGKRFTSEYSPGVKIKKGEHFSKTTEFKKGMIPWNKYLESINCKHCQKEFHPRYSTKKFCSKDCYSQYQLDKPSLNKGKKFPQYTGENHPLWKGKKASYSAKHHWIRRELGQPKICEICKRTEKLQWANKSGKYLRDINDWLSLCIWCHKKYDKEIRLDSQATRGDDFL